MSTLALAGLSYALPAVVAGGVAVVHALLARRRPGEALDAFDRLLLMLTGAVVGALWILVVPVYLAGWCRDRLPKHVASLRARLHRPARAAEEALHPAAPDPAGFPVEVRRRFR